MWLLGNLQDNPGVCNKRYNHKRDSDFLNCIFQHLYPLNGWLIHTIPYTWQPFEPPWDPTLTNSGNEEALRDLLLNLENLDIHTKHTSQDENFELHFFEWIEYFSIINLIPGPSMVNPGLFDSPELLTYCCSHSVSSHGLYLTLIFFSVLSNLSTVTSVCLIELEANSCPTSVKLVSNSWTSVWSLWSTTMTN